MWKLWESRRRRGRRAKESDCHAALIAAGWHLMRKFFWKVRRPTRSELSRGRRVTVIEVSRPGGSCWYRREGRHAMPNKAAVLSRQFLMAVTAYGSRAWAQVLD